MKKDNTKKVLAINVIAILVLAAAVGYMVYMLVTRKNPGIWFAVVLSSCVLLFWLLMDIIKPFVSGEFEGKTAEQMKAYKIYCLMSLVGYAGLVWFAVSAANSTGIYGAVAFAVATMLKRRLLDDYNGDTGEDESGEEADPETYDAATAIAEKTETDADAASDEKTDTGEETPGDHEA